MKTAPQAAVIGAGILGLLVARALLRLGWRVAVYESLSEAAYSESTGFAAGGMLAPYSELESSEPMIAEMGVVSLALWRELAATLPGESVFTQRGSLLLAHGRDFPYYEQLLRRITTVAPQTAYRGLRVAELEAELAPTFGEGLWLPDEAHVDPRSLLPLLVQQLRAAGVSFHWQSPISASEPYAITSDAGRQRCDGVFDCRGYGAAHDQPELRAVRGEAFLLHAPLVQISRPVRLMHPRYAVYIVPRALATYYVGATAIESASTAPVTVRSTLELLSAAFSVHPGLSEATVISSLHGLRPAYPNHRPRILVEAGRICLNGLYRHGFLLAPYLAEQLAAWLSDRPYRDDLFTFA